MIELNWIRVLIGRRVDRRRDEPVPLNPEENSRGGRVLVREGSTRAITIEDPRISRGRQESTLESVSFVTENYENGN